MLSKTFFNELEKLIKQAETISFKLKPYSEDYKPSRTTLIINGIANTYISDEGDDYKNWNREIKDLFTKHNAEKLLPFNFFTGLDISKKNNQNIRKVISNLEMMRASESVEKTESIKYRKEINSELIRQIEILRQILNDPPKKEKIQITIEVDTHKVHKEQNGKRLTHKFEIGKNKRFECLVKIAKSTKRLTYLQCGYSTTQTASSEITKINEALNNSLNLAPNELLIKREINRDVFDVDIV